MHALFQLEELSIKMVQIPFFVIGLSLPAEGILGMVHLSSQSPAGDKKSSYAYGPHGIQTVGILEDPGLQGGGNDSPGEAVHLYGIEHLLYSIPAQSLALQEGARRPKPAWPDGSCPDPCPFLDSRS